jgi:primosomal protein N' (replication factor Y)
LPLSIPQSYTFGVPLELQDDIKVGCRVEVQFGQRKIYSGLVKRLHNEKPDIYEQQLKFWEWIASYYACAEGDVMNAALPSHLKLVSETCVVLNEDVSIDANELTDDEFLLLQALDIKRNQQDIK